MLANEKISVIIPVTERGRTSDLSALHAEYKEQVEKTNHRYEFVYVLDGDFPEAFSTVKQLRNSDERIKIIKLAKNFGEATALTVGFENSDGGVILTLPSYSQVESEDLGKIFELLDTCDMVVVRRWPRIDSFFNRIQGGVFNYLIRKMTGANFHDLGCAVRILNRKVLQEVTIYGDQHRFLPLLADRYGFKIKEIEIKQSKKDAFKRIHSPGIYTRRLLDLLSVFFLIKFTKKPLRFFGISGSVVFGFGAIIGFILLIQRMFFRIGLADRPIVLVSLLFIVLGVQIFAIGLIGELIIFTHAKDLKEYTIEQIIN